jgi:hypothetical protein
MPGTQIAAQRQVYVFDSALPELQALIDAVNAAGTHSRIILLDPGSDGVLQLAGALAGESDLAAIHLFSHGSAGCLWGRQHSTWSPFPVTAKRLRRSGLR